MLSPLQSPSRAVVFVGIMLLLIAMLGIPLFFGIVAQLAHASQNTLYFFSRISYWVCLIIILVYATKIERRPLLLWQEKKYPFSFYILSFFAIITILLFGNVLLGIIANIIKWKGDSSKFLRMVQVFRNNKPVMVFTCITAAVVEELILRGYLMPRLQELLKKPWLSIFISSALFGALHYGYGNMMQVIGPFFIGLTLAAHYNKYKNIKILIFCHFCWDIWVLLLNIYTAHK